MQCVNMIGNGNTSNTLNKSQIRNVGFSPELKHIDAFASIPYTSYLHILHLLGKAFPDYHTQDYWEKGQTRMSMATFWHITVSIQKFSAIDHKTCQIKLQLYV